MLMHVQVEHRLSKAGGVVNYHTHTTLSQIALPETKTEPITVLSHAAANSNPKNVATVYVETWVLRQTPELP